MKRSNKIKTMMGSLLTAGALMCSTAVSADTLADALKWAYETSPTLQINRAALRASDESVVQAGAAKRPSLTASADIGISDNSNAVRDYTDTYRAQLDASLLLYDGGRTDAAVRAARATVASQRATLLSVEQDILLGAIQAYVDVRRDARFVTLARNNVGVIGQQVRAAKDRFEVGEVTRTDVSQADARLASARSNLSTNEGAYQRSLQAYLAAVGRPANNLAPPPALPKLPATLAEASSIAKSQHPRIQSAQYALTAAEFDVLRARAAKGPTVSLGANVTYSENVQVYGQDLTSGSLALSGNMPLIDGGQNDSLIRSALANVDRRKAEIQDAARSIEQNTSLAWANLEVARASIRSSVQQIRAARVAFDGIQEEAKLGARTTLDVLDAEQEVLNAESGLASAQRDEYVAAYNLISAMGLLTTDYLKLPVKKYDPNEYYKAVNGEPLSREKSALRRIDSRWNN